MTVQRGKKRRKYRSQRSSASDRSRRTDSPREGGCDLLSSTIGTANGTFLKFGAGGVKAQGEESVSGDCLGERRWEPEGSSDGFRSRRFEL